MKVVYKFESPPDSFEKSLFLVGPTPRMDDVLSWRPEALAILEKLEYDGVVFVLEYRPGTVSISNLDKLDYDKQVSWEHDALNMSDYVVAWVPRNLATMPAFTTNIEFGLLAQSRKLLFGAPPNAPKNGYLRFCAKKYEIPAFDNLEKVLTEAVSRLGVGALRFGGERNIPLFIWNSSHFQSWYKAQKSVGNYLNSAEVLFAPLTGYHPFSPFYIAFHANVHVESENRNKKNKSEIIFARWDISSILLYKKGESIPETEVVLVKEYRNPVNNSSGFVWELPGGSSPDFSLSPRDVAVTETSEEVGLAIEPHRFVEHGSRQQRATMSADKAHLFSAELTDEEVVYLRSQKGIPHGANLEDPSGERLYIEIKTVQEILDEKLVDFSNIGMIFEALNSVF